MNNEYNDLNPQHESVVLTDKAKLSIYKKSSNSGIPTGILEEVYRRGYNTWNPDLGYTPEQFGFDRVNSFIAGGFAVKLDEDLKKACWKGYEAIGMKMKNGKKVPNCVPVKEGDAEVHSKNPEDPSSRFIGSNELVDIYKKETPGQIIKRVVREAALDVQATPSPTASSIGPSKLSRNARVELSRRGPAGGEGLRNVGANRYSASSPTSNLSAKRLTSGSTTATAKTLTPQRVSANQPAPKTAAAPTSAPKPTASFGSSSRPTTVSATSGGVEKSGGFKLSSGMSDAGKAKVKPTAPVEVPAAAGKVAGALGKLARAATGPAATAAMTVMEPTPAGEKRSEFQRQSDVAKGISYKPQGRSVSQYEKDVLTPKASEAPRPKVDAPTPPSRPEYFSRGQAFSAAREKAGGGEGQFKYDDKSYQTNIKSEPYIPAAKQKQTGIEAESGKSLKKIKEAIAEATYQGKKVPLNKPMKGDVKKSKVFVDPDGDGKAQKVNFGDKSLSIKKHIPARKKSYCARSGGQGNLTDKTSANYWSRRAWNCEETEMDEGYSTYSGKSHSLPPFGDKRTDPLKKKRGEDRTLGQYTRDFTPFYAKRKLSKELGDLKSDIKSNLGKHTKPILPEETEVNELSVPAGTTGKRKDVSTPMVAVRMASGKIEKHPPGKSGSSGGGDE